MQLVYTLFHIVANGNRSTMYFKALLLLLYFSTFCGGFARDSEDFEIIDASDLSAIAENCADAILSGQLTADEAVKLFKVAIEFLEGTSANRRSTALDERATRLIELATGIPGVNSSTRGRVVRPDDSDDDFCEITVARKKRKVSLDTMRVILKMVDERKTMKTIQAKYRWYQHHHLERFRACLRSEGSQQTRIEEINAYALSMVIRYREQHRAIRGWMIRNWAAQRAREIGANFFQASSSWLDNFKRRNKIVGRKVTDHIGRRKQQNQEQTQRIIDEFVTTFGRLRTSFSDSAIWNFDHSGFAYELTAERTLSWGGERDTVVQVDQPNKATHSFTIIPIITRDGRAIGPLLICLQEPNGRFGPRVGPEVQRLESLYANIQVICSSSGKMTTNLMHDWIDRVVIPTAQAESVSLPQSGLDANGEPIAGTSRNSSRVLLLGDSWGGNTNTGIQEHLQQNGIHFLQIPAGTTSVLQPLDVQFFREYKYFIKRIFMQLNILNRTNEATSREGAMNIHSLVWNQFQSPIYSDLLRFAWRNVDQTFSHHELSTLARRPALTPTLQFGFRPGHKCEIDNCTEPAFVQCSHCNRRVCLSHFLQRVCYHQEVHQAEDLMELTFEQNEGALDAEEREFDRMFVEPADAVGGALFNSSISGDFMVIEEPSTRPTTVAPVNTTTAQPATSTTPRPDPPSAGSSGGSGGKALTGVVASLAAGAGGGYIAGSALSAGAASGAASGALAATGIQMSEFVAGASIGGEAGAASESSGTASRALKDSEEFIEIFNRDKIPLQTLRRRYNVAASAERQRLIQTNEIRPPKYSI